MRKLRNKVAQFHIKKMKELGFKPRMQRDGPVGLRTVLNIFIVIYFNKFGIVNFKIIGGQNYRWSSGRTYKKVFTICQIQKRVTFQREKRKKNLKFFLCVLR